MASSEGGSRFKRKKMEATERQRHAPYCTLEDLLERGLEGLMLPLQSLGMTRRDLPFFLRDTCIHAIKVIVIL